MDINMEEVYKIANDYDVKLVKLTGGITFTTQEYQLISFIQSNIMDKYDLTIKKRDDVFIVYFNECSDQRKRKKL